MTIIPDRLIEYHPDKSYGTYKLRPGGNPVLVSYVHPDLVKRLVKDMPHIYEFRNTLNRLAQAETSLYEFEKCQESGFKRVDKDAIAYNLLDPEDLELIEANRLCSNYCFSFFNVIELMEVKNKKLYGEDSETYKQFKIYDNTFFQDYFEYRLVKQLRNSLHISDAISGIWEENGIKAALFQKYRLQQFSKFSTPHFAQDWKERENSFPALPIFKASIIYLKRLINLNLLLNKQLYHDAAQTTLQNFGESNKRDLSIAERLKSGINSFQIIPQKLSRQILEYLKDIEDNEHTFS